MARGQTAVLSSHGVSK